MLHLIPAPVHRAGLRIAHALRLLWWRTVRPGISGCRALAFDSEGRVLLIRHSYGSNNWMPPGGAMQRGEDPVLAAVRELLEETQCQLIDPVFVALIEEDMRGARNGVHIVAGQTADTPRPDGREVIEARFFPLDDLPTNMSPYFREQLPVWAKAAKAARRPDAGEPPRPPAPTA
jgi:8-oxo-dGTP pyrophosphatase MutT (NUDIX family)